MKVGDLIKLLEDAVKDLNGKKVPGAEFSDACEEVIKNSGIISETSLECNGSYITIDLSTFGITRIFRLKPVYRKHRARWDGLSDYIDHVEIEYPFNLPMNTEVENTRRLLRYELAGNRKNDVERELDDLKKQVVEYEKVYAEMDKIMKEES